MNGIDAVITWVDGHCPLHQKKRAAFDTSGHHPESATPIRWEQDDEITFLLRSLDRYAPWLRKVFIVTDGQTPPIFGLSRALRQKIEIVDHKVIFRGYEDALPTFNSASINSVIHCIPGLSDQFICFNDDILFTAPVSPEDFFLDGKIIIRGVFDPQMVEGILYTNHRRNAAKLLGISEQQMFRAAHVCVPMIKSLVDQFYSIREDVLRENIKHRFRSDDQYLPSALSTYLALEADRATLLPYKDWHFVTAVDCRSEDPKRIRKSLNRLRKNGVKMACVNDLASAKKALPSSEWRIAKAVEGGNIGAARHMIRRYLCSV